MKNSSNRNTGRAKKFDILCEIVVNFFPPNLQFFVGGFRPHIFHILWQYLVTFKNYNYLNLSVHFSKWSTNYKLRNAMVSFFVGKKRMATEFVRSESIVTTVWLYFIFYAVLSVRF